MNNSELLSFIKEKGNQVKPYIKEIKDFPEPGVSFKDITPILQHPQLFSEVNNSLMQLVKSFGQVDVIVSPESRGFLFGPVVADRLKIGFIPARKPGKLPREVIEDTYGMEYGQNRIQIHKDAIQPGQRIVIVDDVLATGGTTKAIAELIKRSGGILAGYVFFITLEYLDGLQLLGKENVLSMVAYK